MLVALIVAALVAAAFGAIGNLAGNGVVGTTDLPFANYSPPVNGLSDIVLTHSYLFETPFSSVWGAFATLQQNLQ